MVSCDGQNGIESCLIEMGMSGQFETSANKRKGSATG